MEIDEQPLKASMNKYHKYNTRQKTTVTEWYACYSFIYIVLKQTKLSHIFRSTEVINNKNKEIIITGQERDSHWGEQSASNTGVNEEADRNSVLKLCGCLFFS